MTLYFLKNIVKRKESSPCSVSLQRPSIKQKAYSPLRSRWDNFIMHITIVLIQYSVSLSPAIRLVRANCGIYAEPLCCLCFQHHCKDLWPPLGLYSLDHFLVFHYSLAFQEIYKKKKYARFVQFWLQAFFPNLTAFSPVYFTAHFFPQISCYSSQPAEFST